VLGFRVGATEQQARCRNAFANRNTRGQAQSVLLKPDPPQPDRAVHSSDRSPNGSSKSPSSAASLIRLKRGEDISIWANGDFHLASTAAIRQVL
jgi:hypothetical protein